MTRIRFEDLPSTNTPRNAENLNKLNNVVISPTEPETGEEVWIQKGKNLWGNIKRDISNIGVTTNINNSKFTVSGTASSAAWLYDTQGRPSIYLKAGTYTFSIKNFSGTFSSPISIQLRTDNGALFDEVVNSSTIKTFVETFTLENDGVLFYDNYINTSGTVFTNVSYDMQIEQGETATEFEEYIDKKIYTKNENGVYEEFYDENNKPITYSVNIQGGQTYTMSIIKRYVDVYFKMELNQYYSTIIKYTIDTKNTIYGSGVAMSADSDTGLEYYVSESKISGKTLKHTRCGFFGIGANGGYYADRNEKWNYIIYQIVTYD